MNNVIIHGPGGDEFNTDAYEYDTESNKLKFHRLTTSSWLVFDDVDITIEITGFLVEITCTYTN